MGPNGPLLSGPWRKCTLLVSHGTRLQWRPHKNLPAAAALNTEPALGLKPQAGSDAKRRLQLLLRQLRRSGGASFPTGPWGHV